MAALAATPVIAFGVASAATHVYSYDPADAATRGVTGPLTFEVYKGLLGGTKILNLRSTEAAATADLRHATPRDLGPGGPGSALNLPVNARNIYEIAASDEGVALMSALCPGSTRAWLVFGPMGFDESLKIDVLGNSPASGPKVRVCHVLAYDFHGEWRGPPSGPVLKERDVLRGRYPGT
jgi:hypothetical protein